MRGLHMDAREALPTLEYPDHPAKLKGPHKPVIVNGDLRRFLGRDVSTRPAIARYISRYVKARGLQVQVDQTKFRPDADLRAILGVEECTFLQVRIVIGEWCAQVEGGTTFVVLMYGSLFIFRSALRRLLPASFGHRH